MRGGGEGCKTRTTKALLLFLPICGPGGPGGHQCFPCVNAVPSVSRGALQLLLPGPRPLREAHELSGLRAVHRVGSICVTVSRVLCIWRRMAVQGTLELWVDVMAAADALRLPMWDVALPPPEEFELRVRFVPFRSHFPFVLWSYQGRCTRITCSRC